MRERLAMLKLIEISFIYDKLKLGNTSKELFVIRMIGILYDKMSNRAV